MAIFFSREPDKSSSLAHTIAISAIYGFVFARDGKTGTGQRSFSNDARKGGERFEKISARGDAGAFSGGVSLGLGLSAGAAAGPAGGFSGGRAARRSVCGPHL